jgi:hypothetical protein
LIVGIRAIAARRNKSGVPALTELVDQDRRDNKHSDRDLRQSLP